MQTQSNIHTKTQRHKDIYKNTQNHHREYILHTTYHPVPSKTHPSFSLNPVNSTPSPTLHGFQVFRIYEAMIHAMKPNQQPPGDQHPTSHPLGVPFKGSLGILKGSRVSFQVKSLWGVELCNWGTLDAIQGYSRVMLVSHRSFRSYMNLCRTIVIFKH